MSICNRKRQTGVSLLEVLIALVVVTIGLLGFAAMQGTSVRNSQSSHHMTLATTLAYDALDQARAGEDLANVAAFLQTDDVQNRFPGALTVNITNVAPNATVTLSWNDERVAVQGNAALSAPNQVTVTTQL